MATVRSDLNAMFAEHSAQARANDRTRAAVLRRFDAADARRQFSLDQAAEARANHAASLARSRAEAHQAASEHNTIEDCHDLRGVEHNNTNIDRNLSRTKVDLQRLGTFGNRYLVDSNSTKGITKDITSTNDSPTTVGEAINSVDTETSITNKLRPETEIGTGVASIWQSNPLPLLSAGLTSSISIQNKSPSVDQIASQSTGSSLQNCADKTGEFAEEVPIVSTNTASSAAGMSLSTVVDAADAGSPAGANMVVPSVTKATASIESVSHTRSATLPIPLGAVPMTVALRSLQNVSRFEIRLDPVELGRIDVRLDIDKDAGTVEADLVIERPSTLALLQRDVTTLQHAFEQAGLDASTGISMSLRGDGLTDHKGNSSNPSSNNTSHVSPQNKIDTTDHMPRRLLRPSGIDMLI